MLTSLPRKFSPRMSNQLCNVAPGSIASDFFSKQVLKIACLRKLRSGLAEPEAKDLLIRGSFRTCRRADSHNHRKGREATPNAVAYGAARLSTGPARTTSKRSACMELTCPLNEGRTQTAKRQVGVGCM